MTKEISTIQKAKIVSRAVEEIQALKRNVVLNFLEIGKRLDDIQRNGYWACYADHLKNFDDFLKEIKMGRATAYNLMAIWRKFGEFLTSKNLDVDYFRLVKLLPVAGDASPEVKEEWLLKASELPLDGFDNEIREAKGKITNEECQHPKDRKILIVKCLDCGLMWRATKEEIEYAFKNLKK